MSDKREKIIKNNIDLVFNLVSEFGKDEAWKHAEYFSSPKWRQFKDVIGFAGCISFAKYRRKQKTITVNGVEVPAPLSVEPAKSTKYYYIAQTHERGYKSATWMSDQFDTLVFKRGIYTNENHIKQYVKALWGE